MEEPRSQVTAIGRGERRRCLAVRSQVVFPRAVVTLEVSRPENLALLAAHPGGDAELVAVPLADPPLEGVPLALHPVGTASRLLDRIRMPDDSERIVLQGLRRVGLAGLREEDGMLSAATYELACDDCDPKRLNAGVDRVLDMVGELVRSDPRYSEEVHRTLLLNRGEVATFALLVASKLHLSYADCARLLIELDPRRQLELLAEQVRAELARAELTREVHRKLEERARRSYLEEQLAVIQGELGVEDPVEREAARLEERIGTSGMGPTYRERALTELSRFRRAASGSSEASRLRTWLEWLIELPWGVASPDPEGLDGSFARVIEAIDRTHTGLADAKHRVVEFLAVRHLCGSGHGTVLCFSGPPGTGKTSMAASVAEALGRELVRVSAGDLDGEHSLRGLHPTQPGAVPGCVLEGLHRARTLNPVVLIDDIDQLADGGEEAAGALLQLLDRELNRSFVDHYLGLAFDLSRCIFLVTACDEDHLPGSLHERLEVIRFGSYTEAEKLAIAREHLIPRAREDAGLDRYQFRVTPGALRELVRGYTQEAGVRQLARLLASLARKAAVHVLQGNYGLLVRKAFLPDLLGPGVVDEDIRPTRPQVGIATGLAWTSAGGALLPIEAVGMPGNGSTILTGSVGDVMRESVQAAISHVRTRFDELGLPHDALDALDLHVHFPAGAVPKDGPSAGVAIATALVSLLTGVPVRHDVAMTGELSLHGAVLPIGGLREKLLTAVRAGLSTVVVPARNGEEVLRLPADVRRQLEIRLADDFATCLGAALAPPRKRSGRAGRNRKGRRAPRLDRSGSAGAGHPGRRGRGDSALHPDPGRAN